MNRGTLRGVTLPSNKTIALGVFMLAIIATVVVTRMDSPTPEVLVVFEDEAAQRDPVLEQDTDSDGLKDWEEVLLKTNPEVSDTDGDGKTDLVERDEERLREQERQEEFVNSLNPKDDENWGDLSFTDQVSRVFISEYLSLKKSGGIVTGADTIKIVQNLPQYTPPEKTQNPYTRSDILISTDSSTSALRAYGNAVGSVLAVPEGDVVPNELLAFQAFIETGSSEALAQEMSSVVDRYTLVISGLKGLYVPATLADKHLAIMNALLAVREDLVAFQKIGDDPFLALSAIETYNKNTTRRGIVFEEMRTALTDADIVFSEIEPGHLLMFDGN